MRLRWFKPRFTSQTCERQHKKTEKKQKTIHIKGMTCDHCVKRTKKAIQGIDGVENVDVDLKNEKALVKLTLDVKEKRFKETIGEAGYEVSQ